VCRSPLHAAVNSIPVRTRIGCAMSCCYCVTANLARRHSSFSLDDVLSEVGAVVAHANEHGISPVPVFFADDEMNLPDEKHPLALLSALRQRGLDEKLIWRGYFNPTPFSRELARLVRETNGHASLTVDSASDAVLARNRKPFRRKHLDALIALLEEEGVSADLGLVFGLPGETDETIAETAAWVRDLPGRIRVVYSLGARVYPHTPLAEAALERPDLVLGDDPAFLAPTVYSSPRPPRELARELAEAFSGLPNVSRLGAGFKTGRTTMSDAYRAATEAGDVDWDDVLDDAERPGDAQGSPGRNLSSCMQIAIWHGRYDLASRAAARLARHPHDLPPGVSRLQVRTARVVYSLMGRRQRKAA
jgi:hypothetical protein